MDQAEVEYVVFDVRETVQAEVTVDDLLGERGSGSVLGFKSESIVLAYPTMRDLLER